VPLLMVERWLRRAGTRATSADIEFEHDYGAARVGALAAMEYGAD
jgi:hypothetical protein